MYIHTYICTYILCINYYVLCNKSADHCVWLNILHTDIHMYVCAYMYVHIYSKSTLHILVTLPSTVKKDRNFAHLLHTQYVGF